MTLIKSISGIRGTIGGAPGEGLSPLDIVKFAYAYCEKMRERWPESNIFMVSSMAYEDMINRAAAMGAKSFLFKPFTRDDLLQGLRGVLESVTKK